MNVYHPNLIFNFISRVFKIRFVLHSLFFHRYNNKEVTAKFMVIHRGFNGDKDKLFLMPFQMTAEDDKGYGKIRSLIGRCMT